MSPSPSPSSSLPATLSLSCKGLSSVFAAAVDVVRKVFLPGTQSCRGLFINYMTSSHNTRPLWTGLISASLTHPQQCHPAAVQLLTQTSSSLSTACSKCRHGRRDQIGPRCTISREWLRAGCQNWSNNKQEGSMWRMSRPRLLVF